jgi:hypothetical protein
MPHGLRSVQPVRFHGKDRLGATPRLIVLFALAAGLAAALCVAQAEEAKANGAAPVKFDPKKFSHPTEITNKWMPSKSGMRWSYSGTSVEDDGKVVRHQIEMTITDLVKVIGGVQAVVSYELDWNDNELVEAELSFLAQDDDGNVWRLGEYPEEYEDGKLIKAPAWIHGLEGARAGIMMQASPRVGSPGYSQGWAPAVGWKDRAQTYAVGQRVMVKTGSYEDVIVIKETARGEKDAAQLKYYAPNVGNVKVGWIGDKRLAQERLELVEFEQVDEKTLADVRQRAIDLEKSAYQHGGKAYNPTTPVFSPKL